MPIDGIKIVIGADTNSAVQGVGKVNKSFKEIEVTFANLIKSSGDVGKAIDTLGKEGVLSIAFLEKEIKDFKQAFANATDPAEAKKFADVLQILTVKQQQLVSAGLGVEQVNKKIASSHGANVQATSRLSSSFLGLSKIFNALPPEAAHLTHAFEGIVQSFERIGHGSESAGDKVKKFASALGGVGLGLAISIVAGLLVNLVTELLHSDEAFIKAAQSSQDFTNHLEDTKTALDNLKGAVDLNKDISKLKFEIQFGKDRAGELALENDVNKNILFITRANDEVQKLLDDVARKVEEASQVLSKRGFVFFENLLSAPQDAAKVAQDVQRGSKKILDKLEDGDKDFIEELVKSAEAIDKIRKDIKSTEDENLKLLLQGDLDAANKRRAAAKKANDEFAALLRSRQDIIKEFTAKFASIKDPFPNFFTKNLPLGKVEDKGLRAALENAFKVLSTAAKDIFDTNKIDPLTVPLEIIFKPEIVGKSAIVRQIEDKFGELKKDIEDAVNKGIFEVPVDFRIAPEGDGDALAVAEKRINEFVSKIEGLTGQENAILAVNTQFLVNLDDKTARDEINKVIHRLNGIASGMHPEVHIDAEGKITIKVNKDKIIEDTVRAINEAIQQGAVDLFTGFGEALGDALSEGINTDGVKKIQTVLAGILGSIGRQLIQAGVLLLKLGDVIKSITSNPALAIALGVALVALSKVITNNLNKKRELGGHVNPGETYNVNERGEEIYKPVVGKAYRIRGGEQAFTPRMSGRIIPAWQAKALARANGIPALEGGGVVSGPTFALIGEGSGAGAGNPEVIAPLSDLPKLLGLGARTPPPEASRRRAIIRGRDLKLLDARENKSQRR